MSKLYRSQENKILGGICGGLGEYLGIDPTLVRIFFVIFSLASGSGVLVYLLLWIIIPSAGETSGTEEFSSRTRQMGRELGEALRNPNPGAMRWIGAGLVAAGLIFLLQNFNFPWLRWLNQDILWPLLLIAGGIALLLRAVKGE